MVFWPGNASMEQMLWGELCLHVLKNLVKVIFFGCWIIVKFFLECLDILQFLSSKVKRCIEKQNRFVCICQITHCLLGFYIFEMC